MSKRAWAIAAVVGGTLSVILAVVVAVQAAALHRLGSQVLWEAVPQWLSALGSFATIAAVVVAWRAYRREDAARAEATAREDAARVEAAAREDAARLDAANREAAAKRAETRQEAAVVLAPLMELVDESNPTGLIPTMVGVAGAAEAAQLVLERRGPFVEDLERRWSALRDRFWIHFLSRGSSQMISAAYDLRTNMDANLMMLAESTPVMVELFNLARSPDSNDGAVQERIEELQHQLELSTSNAWEDCDRALQKLFDLTGLSEDPDITSPPLPPHFTGAA